MEPQNQQWTMMPENNEYNNIQDINQNGTYNYLKQNTMEIPPKIKKICAFMSFAYAAILITIIVLINNGTIGNWLTSLFYQGNGLGDYAQALESALQMEKNLLAIVEGLIIVPLLISIIYAKKNGINYFKNPTKSKFRVASSLLVCVIIVDLLLGSVGAIIGAIFAIIAGIIFLRNS